MAVFDQSIVGIQQWSIFRTDMFDKSLSSRYLSCKWLLCLILKLYISSCDPKRGDLYQVYDSFRSPSIKEAPFACTLLPGVTSSESHCRNLVVLRYTRELMIRSVHTIQFWSNYHFNFFVYDEKRWCSHHPIFPSNYFVMYSRETRQFLFWEFRPISLQLSPALAAIFWKYFAESSVGNKKLVALLI